MHKPLQKKTAENNSSYVKKREQDNSQKINYQPNNIATFNDTHISKSIAQIKPQNELHYTDTSALLHSESNNKTSPILQFKVSTDNEPSRNIVKANTTGIPGETKAEFEGKSGFSFDNVRVHYNSPKPMQFQALAYTMGNEVHIGPSQEKHLRHELGHVIQQKQGIVKPTGVINNIPVNTDHSLEERAGNIGENKGYENQKQGGVMQFRIDDKAVVLAAAQNYHNAAMFWANASEAVNAFVLKLNNTENTFINPKMEENMYRKSVDARSTNAGEAFEPLNWRPNDDKYEEYIGPGVGSGYDLLKYKSDTNETNGTTTSGAVENYGEVKTLDNQRTYNSITSVLVDAKVFKATKTLSQIIVCVDNISYHTLWDIFNGSNTTFIDGGITYYKDSNPDAYPCEIIIINKYSALDKFIVYRKNKSNARPVSKSTKKSDAEIFDRPMVAFIPQPNNVGITRMEFEPMTDEVVENSEKEDDFFEPVVENSFNEEDDPYEDFFPQTPQ